MKMKFLKKRARKVMETGAESLQAGVEGTARAAGKAATRARVAAGAAGAMAAVGTGLAARKVKIRSWPIHKTRKAIATVKGVAKTAGKAALAAGLAARWRRHRARDRAAPGPALQRVRPRTASAWSPKYSTTSRLQEGLRRTLAR